MLSTTVMESATPSMASNSTSRSTTAMPTSNHAAIAIAQKSLTIASRPLPSLLRYVDHDLMRNATIHNHPLHPKSSCSICLFDWTAPFSRTKTDPPGSQDIVSTFLPLSPCGHWAHYRCLIWLATRSGTHHNRCCTCGVQLFHWEGITALTLATRTNLTMQDNTLDTADYEADCAAIDSLIHALFWQHLAQTSEYTDKSPDLVRCFYDVLDALQRMKKPRARWLQYETATGHFLFGMLVSIKMRRYLIEQHEGIVGTEGWTAFEEGARALQAKIGVEVDGE